MLKTKTYTQQELRRLIDVRPLDAPEFIARELAPKRNRYCLCVFVINEGQKIKKQIEDMKKYTNLIDIIVADGGSTDGSLDDSHFLTRNSVSRLLIKKGPGGLSTQMRMAFAYAISNGYKGVVTVDGNRKDGLEAIPSFIQSLDDGYDHVQGSRFVKDGKAVNTPLGRLLGLKLLHTPIVSLAARYRYTDTTNGFRAYSMRLLTDPKIQVFRDVFNSYELHYYLAVKSARLGYKITEIPVTRTYPASGRTPTKISPVRGNLLILHILPAQIRGL